MSIIKKDIKKSFKICLAITDTTGISNIYNYNYPISLRNIIQDDKDYDKVYNVTFRFRSRTSTNANVNLSSDYVYSLHLLFNNLPINSYSSNIAKINNVVGILNLEPDLYRNSTAGTILPLILNANECDNAPFQINSLRNLTNIQLQVMRNFNDIYIPASNGDTLYGCILTFTEA